MSYVEEVVKEEFRSLVMSDERLRRVAQMMYMCKGIGDINDGILRKQFNKYLEMIKKGG